MRRLSREIWVVFCSLVLLAAGFVWLVGLVFNDSR